VETALSIVATAQRDRSSCAAAQARSLEGTLFPKQISDRTIVEGSLGIVVLLLCVCAVACARIYVG